jgi:hypothetical protein
MSGDGLFLRLFFVTIVVRLNPPVSVATHGDGRLA